MHKEGFYRRDIKITSQKSACLPTCLSAHLPACLPVCLCLCLCLFGGFDHTNQPNLLCNLGFLLPRGDFTACKGSSAPLKCQRRNGQMCAVVLTLTTNVLEPVRVEGELAPTQQPITTRMARCIW